MRTLDMDAWYKNLIWVQCTYEIVDLIEVGVEIFTFKCGATAHHATTISGIGISQELTLDVLNGIVHEVKGIVPW